MGKHFDRIKSYGESYYDSSEGYKRARRKQRADKNQKILLSILIGIGSFVMLSKFLLGIILIALGILGFILKERSFRRR